MNAVRVFYGLGIGFMLVLLVGFGIAAFYNPPYYGDWESYGRNVVIITSICGLAFALLGLFLPSRLNTMRLGLLSGGLLTLLPEIGFCAYAIGFVWAFVATLMMLAILVLAGYYNLVMRKEAKE